MKRMYSKEQLDSLTKESLGNLPSGTIKSFIGLNNSGKPIKEQLKVAQYNSDYKYLYIVYGLQLKGEVETYEIPAFSFISSQDVNTVDNLYLAITNSRSGSVKIAYSLSMTGQAYMDVLKGTGTDNYILENTESGLSITGCAVLELHLATGGCRYFER